MAKVSIIVPVYKAEAFLHRCVDSILHQRYQDFDLILVDDGSPDKCGQICDDYTAKDSRVKVIHQENAGCSAARNAGIDYAMNNSDSRWIAFVDSDDWLHRDYLSCLLNAAEETNTKLTICNCVWVDAYCEDVVYDHVECEVLESEKAFVQYYANCTPPWGKLIEKTLLKGLRFPVGIRYEDAYITHLLAFSAGHIAVCHAELYYYFNNEKSYTRTGWNKERMESVRVHEYRLSYFHEKGYEDAYSRELKEYIERITSHLSELSDIINRNSEYQETFDELRTKLRAAVHKGEELGVCARNRNYIMTYAYVVPFDVVWKILRQIQRLWRRIRK